MPLDLQYNTFLLKLEGIHVLWTYSHIYLNIFCKLIALICFFSSDIWKKKVAFVIADPFYKKNLGRGSPFNVSYQKCCKKNIYVNDSQNLAFPTSHFVIELLPFDYLSNQKQWVNKKCISWGITLHTVVTHF